MNDQEKNEYLNKLFEDNTVLDGLEGDILSKSKALFSELKKGKERLDELNRELKNLENVLLSGQSKLEGFASLLIDEEIKRQS